MFLEKKNILAIKIRSTSEIENINEIDTTYYNIIDKYKILFYEISIFKLKNSSQIDDITYYRAEINSEQCFHSQKELKINFINYVSLNHFNSFKRSKISEIWTFTQVYSLIKEFIENEYKNVSFIEKKYLSIYLWINIMQFQKIAPLLFDDLIDEIYLLPKNGNPIIDHSLYGRITFFYTYSPLEINYFIKKVARENKKDLTITNPSFKGDLFFKPFFSVRITGDIKPYSFEGPTANIRKLRTNPLLLTDLVENKTITKEVFEFLKYVIRIPTNITIIGPPNSGKTTLQTCLLNLLPNFWRIISFEQTLEFIPLENQHSHLIRYKFPNYQGSNIKMTIFNQLSHLLHRSPDFVNLGEITNSQEAFAWYQILSSGIPSMQTLHAGGLHSLITRIKNILEIPFDLLLSSFPHIFIFINKKWNEKKLQRRVEFIGELVSESENKITISPIFQLNLKNNKLVLVKSLESLKMWDYLFDKPKSNHINNLKENFNFKHS